MNNSFALDAYRLHDLNIMLKTSSGDIIKMDFSNKQNLSMIHEEGDGTSQDLISFSSLQSFNFSVKGNGIDEQDKKEIKELMKIAQPFIDKFMKELDAGGQRSPVNKEAKHISDLFGPMKAKGSDTKNYTKHSIVEMFDKSLKQVNDINKIFDEAQKLLAKTLNNFDKLTQDIYA